MALNFNKAIQIIANRALKSPVQTKWYSKYQLNPGSIKPPFVLPLEVISELYLEKNKHQKLTFLKRKKNLEKSATCAKKNTAREVSSFVMMNQNASLWAYDLIDSC